MDRAATLQRDAASSLRALLGRDANQPPDLGRFDGEQRVALDAAAASVERGDWQAAHNALHALANAKLHADYLRTLNQAMSDVGEAARIRGVDVMV